MTSLTFALDHRWAPGHMSAYLEDDLGPRRRARLERHVAICPVCARKLRILRGALGALRGLGAAAPDPAPGLGAAVLGRVAREGTGRADGPAP